MSLRDALSAGGAGSLAAVGVDVLVNGGDLIIWLIGFIVDQGPLLYLLFSRLLRLAPEIDWLPAAILKKALLAVTVLVVGVALYRLAIRFFSAVQDRYDD